MKKIGAKIREKRIALFAVTVIAFIGLCCFYVYEVFLGLQRPPFSKPFFFIIPISILPLLAAVVEEEHPYAKAHRDAKEAYIFLSQKLIEIEKKIEELEKEYRSLRRELEEKYGPGCVTVKTVKNNKGKKYMYPVYRTYNRKDIYLKDYRIIVLREKLRRLKKLKKSVREGRNWARLVMEATKPYANAKSSSSYTLT